MARIRDFIDVEASCDSVYRRWIAFEDYPRFMTGVREVRQEDGGRMHWCVEANGRLEEWEAEIVDAVPPQRLAWRAQDHAGVMMCRPTGQDTARVFLEMDQEPVAREPDARHQVAAACRRVHTDLERFKEWVEQTLGH